MADEPKRRRFAGSNLELWLIYLVVTLVIGAVAVWDGHYDIAIACLAFTLLCALFAWRDRNARD